MAQQSDIFYVGQYPIYDTKTANRQRRALRAEF
jgi:hypothetical protein